MEKDKEQIVDNPERAEELQEDLDWEQIDWDWIF